MTTPRRQPVDAGALRPVLRAPERRLDPERLLVAVVRAYLEVEAGRRPLEQLEPALSPSVRDRMRATLDRRRAEAHRAGRTGSAPCPTIESIRAVQVTRPADDVVEAAVAVRIGPRTTAVCVRLEPWRNGWRVAELARPEDGVSPLPSRAVFRPRAAGPARSG